MCAQERRQSIFTTLTDQEIMGCVSVQLRKSVKDLFGDLNIDDPDIVERIKDRMAEDDKKNHILRTLATDFYSEMILRRGTGQSRLTWDRIQELEYEFDKIAVYSQIIKIYNRDKGKNLRFTSVSQAMYYFDKFFRLLPLEIS